MLLGLIICALVILIMGVNLLKQKVNISDLKLWMDCIEADKDVLKEDYDALLASHNELAVYKRNSEATNAAISAQLNTVTKDVEALLGVNHELYHGYELLSFRKSSSDHACCACVSQIMSDAAMVVATQPQSPETAISLVQSKAEANNDPEAALALKEAGGVAADSRHTKVDLSGLAAQLKKMDYLKGQARDDGSLATAAARLETTKLAIDTVPGGQLAIVTADTGSRPAED